MTYGRDSAIRLFLVLSEMNDMYFSPILPGMIVMLLNYISEEEIYFVCSLCVFVLFRSYPRSSRLWICTRNT